MALVAVGPRPMRAGPMAAACLILLCVHNADALALQRMTSALCMSTTTPETQRATDPYRALKNRHSPGGVSSGYFAKPPIFLFSQDKTKGTVVSTRWRAPRQRSAAPTQYA